jgi:poly(A) polymerase
LRKQIHPITLDRIDQDAVKVVRRLTRHGYEAYLVGGCVRDLLLGRRPKDFDVSTNATPTEIKKLFRNCRIIGRRFRLAHIFFGPKIIETATFRATPQHQSDDGNSDPLIWQDNVFGTAEEDAQRRDFTINGLFFDLGGREVIDTVDGLADLKAGLVRTIGDPDIRLQEDPVRILRAIKFATRLDLTLEPQTARAMITHRALIARCSVARVLEEIYRLLHGGAARAAFALMQQTGVLAVLFPELALLVGPAGHEDARRPVPAIRPGRRRRGPLAEHASGETEPSATTAVAAPPARLSSETPLALEVPVDLEAEQQAVAQLIAELGLDTPEARQRAAERLWQHLGALDAHVARTEQQPTHPLLLGALLCCLAEPAMHDEHRLQHSIERIDKLVGTVGMRIQVSRRDKERLKQILVAQRRLVHSRRRGQLIQRDYFAEALQLLQLRNEATGDQQQACDRWADQTAERPARRRRRRRPRRRRAHNGNSGDNGPA